MRVLLKYCGRRAICQKCRQEMVKSEPMVRVWFRYGVEPATFHLKCFLEKVPEWFDRHPYIPHQKKSNCPPEMRNQQKKLSAKLYYHRKQGHEQRVRMLREELEAIRY